MSRLLIGIVMFAVASSYEQSISAWQKHRDAGLRSPNGWLTLVGLFWVKSGDNTIGSAKSNDFVLPANSAPAQIGRLHLDGQTVTFTNLAGAAVTVDDKPVTSPTPLSFNEDHPSIVHAGSVSFLIIKRGDKLAIRAKDSQSPLLKSFTGMKYFPTRPDFHFEAKFIDEPKKVPILNVLGQTDLEESPGIVEFTYQGKQYRLRPITEGDTLFFLFKDPTNKTETYQAGRMLNTPMPVSGKVDLDFNRAYNPPCTFTPYATCPLPPKENSLPIPIEAGERRFGNGHADYAASLN